jgi:DNA-binding NarL/FixJ family response regulator
VIAILLADDHAIVRDGLRALLHAQPDLRVVGDAANGRDAVREASRLQPDVVVMDIAMPEMNGVEAAAQIREARPSTEILVVSMHSSTEHVVRALRAGCRGYLLKDSAGGEVVDAIRAVHAGQRYLGQKIESTVIDDYLAGGERNPLDQLSRREREILRHLAAGSSNIEIARALRLSPKTVHTYRVRMMQKLELQALPQLVRFAIRHGLTPLD